MAALHLDTAKTSRFVTGKVATNGDAADNLSPQCKFIVLLKLSRVFTEFRMT